MNADEILAEVRRCSVKLFVLDGRLKASPPGVLPAALKAAIREGALEIKSLLRDEQDRASADAALELLKRLKGYTLPAGRMPAARGLALRMRALPDPERILNALQNFERELIALGGEHDRKLGEAVAAVLSTFPGARLVQDHR
jgi:hypothetical protein